MANLYRIIADIWSVRPPNMQPPAFQDPLHRFLSALVSEGWQGTLLVVQPARSIPADVQASCAYLLDDMRILTRAGRIDVCEHYGLPQFGVNSIDEGIAALSCEKQPGFVPPNPTENMASIIGESRGGIPAHFFVALIDEYYDAGLRFFFRAYDHAEASMAGSTDGRLFYSVAEDFECDTEALDGRSAHCIGLTIPGGIIMDDAADEIKKNEGVDPQPHRDDDELDMFERLAHEDKEQQ